MSTMSALEIAMAWIGIGLAASTAGWIWPLRRGIAGIVMNGAISIVGALLFGVLGLVLGFYHSSDAGMGFLLVAIGAVGALAVTHAIWGRRTHGPRHAHR